MDQGLPVERGVPWSCKHLTFPSVFVDAAVEFSGIQKTKNVHVKQVAWCFCLSNWLTLTGHIHILMQAHLQR